MLAIYFALAYNELVCSELSLLKFKLLREISAMTLGYNEPYPYRDGYSSVIPRCICIGTS